MHTFKTGFVIDFLVGFDLKISFELWRKQTNLSSYLFHCINSFITYGTFIWINSWFNTDLFRCRCILKECFDWFDLIWKGEYIPRIVSVCVLFSMMMFQLSMHLFRILQNDFSMIELVLLLEQFLQCYYIVQLFRLNCCLYPVV